MLATWFAIGGDVVGYNAMFFCYVRVCSCKHSSVTTITREAAFVFAATELPREVSAKHVAVAKCRPVRMFGYKLQATLS